MLAFFCRLLQGRPAECCGMLRTTLTTTRSTHGTQACCQQSEGNSQFKHYLRSPYSIIHHHYKDSGTVAEAKSFVYNFPKLRGVEEAQLDHTIKLIKDDGHCWKEVELFKEVLLLPPAEYRQRVQLLQDLSLSQPSLYHVLRFSKDTDSVGSVLDGAYLPSFWKPLYQYHRMCDVIIDCLGFSFSEVQDQPLLLFLDPNNTVEILQRFSSIGGVPTRELAKAHPRLLQIPASHLDTWLRLLHRHQVWQFSYTHHTTIMFKTSSFLEVEKRLQILQGLQEWEVILASDRLFEILRSQKHTKRLLNAAESGQIISSLSSAIGAREHTRLKQWRGITPEVVSYVASTLDLPLNQTRELLTGDVYTPFGISNIKTVLRLLLDYGFTREQVLVGAMVLNFEAGVVEQALRDLHARPEAQPFAEWMENPFVLHLLAYCIKKDIPHLDLPIKKVKLETVDFSVPGSDSMNC